MKFILPEGAIKQHVAILGKTGSGKSSTARYIAEHLLDQSKRVCVIDFKGDWCGLKNSADGKSPGYPIIGFGDFKDPKATDVPINGQSGKAVAELITSGNRPAIVGFRGWTRSDAIRFWIDFASTLFNTNSGELYLVADEFHNFAPKGKILDPESGKCLHWSNRLMSEGRGIGLICLIASQRPQKVHNDALTCCETLIAMRVIHEADRQAVKDWIDGCGTKEQGVEVMRDLAQMPRGEAYVWSPEIGYGPQRVKFPLFKTFDSFAPPQLQKSISASGWAEVDLGAVREKLAKVIEEAKANDPRELRARIRDLEKQVAAKVATIKPVVEIRTEERAVLKDGQLARIEKLVEKCAETGRLVAEAVDKLRGIIAPAIGSLAHRPGMPVQRQPLFDTHPFAKVQKRIDAAQLRLLDKPLIDQERIIGKSNGVTCLADGTVIDSSSPTGGLRRMMVALANRGGISAAQVAVRAGLSSKSGSFGTYLGRGRSNGWIIGDRGSLSITADGVRALGEFEMLPEGKELLRYWLNELGNGGSSRILRFLAERYPEEVTADQVAHATELSASSGSFGTYLGKLRSLELVTGSRAALKCSDELFG